MFGIDWGLWVVFGLWLSLTMLCFFTAGLKLYKYLVKKKELKNKPKFTILQGGKKDGPYG